MRQLEDGSTALFACGDCEGSSFGDEGRVVVVQSPGGDMLAAAILLKLLVELEEWSRVEA